MAQTLKEETRDAIVEAALAVFAKKGFRDASIQDVSRLAGLSAGNIYRYFPDKRALYEAALPPRLMEELQSALDRKIAAWDGTPLSVEPGSSGAEGAFRRELVDILIEHRLQWLALLRDRAGEALADRLLAFFGRWLGTLRDGLPLDETRSRTVRLMYRNLITLIASVLAEDDDPEGLRSAIGNCIEYHLAGLAAVMKQWRS